MNIGTFYIVGTPIGHLQDITYRAVSTLQKVSYILVENQRHAQKLLSSLPLYEHNVGDSMQISSQKAKVLTYNDQNEQRMIPKIHDLLEKGENIALISDAGMPLIADPGYKIVHHLRENDMPIEVIPGASAFVTALAGSGLSLEEFIFCGFLPDKRKRRQEKLKAWSEINLPKAHLVIYVAPHDCYDVLQEIDHIFKNYSLTLARELTKIHEEFIYGSAQEITDYCLKNKKFRGEMVLIISFEKTASLEKEYEKLAQFYRICIKTDMSHKDIVQQACFFCDLPKKTIYDYCLKKRNTISLA